MEKFFSENKVDSICKRFPNKYRTSKFDKTSTKTVFFIVLKSCYYSTEATL